MAYDDTNRGVLFKNDKKDSDNHPDLKGKINVDGTEFWLAAWSKKDKDGNKYLSLSVTPKEDDRSKYKKNPLGRSDRGTVADMDSDIPW